MNFQRTFPEEELCFGRMLDAWRIYVQSEQEEENRKCIDKQAEQLNMPADQTLLNTAHIITEMT